MIYEKEEFVEDNTNDPRFPIKQVDRLTAIDGSVVRFIGRAALNMQTPAGIQQIPISFEIQADSLQTAFQKYNESAEPKLAEVKERIQQRLAELGRQEQSRIVTPGQGPAAGPRVIEFDDLKGRG